MPVIRFSQIYSVVFSTAQKFFAQMPASAKPFEMELHDGMSLYRYVGYRSGRPQVSEAGKKLWTPLDKDVTNRWTGLGSDGGGAQGLYLSGEAPGGNNTTFAELIHYQDPSVPPNQKVSYFEYKPGVTPTWVSALASELRSMFMFTLDGSLKGLDLRYTADPNAIVNQIFEQALNQSPEIFMPGMSAESLYFAPGDASFTRAVGNAALGKGYEFVQTTSVRDRGSISIVIGGSPASAFDMLHPEGRATFFLDGIARTSRGVFTIDDMVYNDRYDTTGNGVLPSGSDLNVDFESFRDAARAIENIIPWNLAQEEVESFVNERVQEKLNVMDDPMSQSIDALVAEIATPALNLAIQTMLTDYVVACGPLWEDYDNLVADIGAEGTRSLLGDQIAQPKTQQMTNTSAGPSYVDYCVRSAVLAQQAVYLSNNASDIQRELAQSDAVLSQTSAEIAAQTEALAEVEAQLEQNPEDPTLQQQQADLQKQIEMLNEAQKQAEQDKSDAEARERSNQSESTVNQEDSEATSEAQEQAGEAIFHGE
jgi:hypothetical protein